MAFFTTPTGSTLATGSTIGYEHQFNDADISLYYKQDIVKKLAGTTFSNEYIVVCVFDNFRQQFAFTNRNVRDAFYDTLP